MCLVCIVWNKDYIEVFYQVLCGGYCSSFQTFLCTLDQDTVVCTHLLVFIYFCLAALNRCCKNWVFAVKILNDLFVETEHEQA